MTVVKGGHGCRELVQSVMNLRHRIDQLVGLTGQTESPHVNDMTLKCPQMIVLEFFEQWRILGSRLCV